MIARRALLIGAALLAAAGALAQRTPDAPRLVGNSPPTVAGAGAAGVASHHR